MPARPPPVLGEEATMISWTVEPRKTTTKELAYATHQQGTVDIYLDGAMHSHPFIDVPGGIANFDHHSGGYRELKRYKTPATCEQVLYAHASGQLHALTADFSRETLLHANDGDADTMLSIDMLLDSYNGKSLDTEFHEECVLFQAEVDKFLALRPLNNELERRIARNIAYMSEPLDNHRLNGTYGALTEEQMRACMQQSLHRIDELKRHYGSPNPAIERDLDFEHTILNGSTRTNWLAVVEHGPHARFAIAENLDPSIELVGFIQRRVDGTTYYSFVRPTYSDFPMDELTARLRIAEGCVDCIDTVGGSDENVCAPRNTPSRLTLSDLDRIIEGINAARRNHRAASGTV